MYTFTLQARLHHQLCQHKAIYAYTRQKNTTTNYVDIIQSVHASFDDKTFHVYINKFFSSYSVWYGLVDIAIAKLTHSRCICGSLLHTYSQSLL